MKLCVAQVRPVKGNIEENIGRHKEMITLAIEQNADLIMFPELSITGYEPELAAELATTADDKRFDDFQAISDENSIAIGFGLPVQNENGVSISMAIFEPGKKRKTYSKKYLHTSEDLFFVSGEHFTGLVGEAENIAPAICYELSVPQHAADASQKGASIYIASIVEDIEGVERAIKKLAVIAEKYSMTVLMSNCTGVTGTYDCGGKSSAWNNRGELKGQLRRDEEGILVYDTVTETSLKKKLAAASLK